MKRWSTLGRAGTALALSLAAHYTLLTVRSDEPSMAATSGDSDTLVMAFGTSFADMMAGAQASEPVVEPTLEPVTDATMDPVRPNPTEPATAADAVEPTSLSEPIEPPQTPPTQEPTETARTEPARPNTQAPADTTSADPVESAQASVAPITPVTETVVETALLPTTTSASATPVAPLATEPEPPSEAASPAEPAPQPAAEAIAPAVETTTPTYTRVETVAPAAAEDSVQPIDTPSVPQPVDTAALRPEALAARERVLQAERERRQTEAATRPQPRRQAPGNAEQNTTRGQSDATTRTAPAQTPRTATADAAASASASAAASNYPGQVYRRIQRTRQRSVRGSGTVRIRFSVTASGGLGSIRVSGSSGSGAVDQAALDHVSRAAPFPAPPAGAQTTFVVPITFR